MSLYLAVEVWAFIHLFSFHSAQPISQATIPINMSMSILKHDRISHHPLGAGSYYFKDNFLEYLETLGQPGRPVTKIFVGAQPNSSPHIGNIMNICVAFALAKALIDRGIKASISMDLVDTAPAPEHDLVSSEWNTVPKEPSLYEVFWRIREWLCRVDWTTAWALWDWVWDSKTDRYNGRANNQANPAWYYQTPWWTWPNSRASLQITRPSICLSHTRMRPGW